MKHVILLLSLVVAFSCQDNSSYRYVTNLPSNFKVDQATPLLLFLHGSGERGDDLEKVKVHGPPKLAALGKDFPAIVISPQCPSDERWDTNRLEALLKEVQSKYRIDKSRIYLTGLSMGGYGTMSWVYAHPEHFAAIAPICGGQLEKGKSEGIKDIPLWAFHGDQDNVVPIEQTNAYIQELKDVGGNPKYTIYLGVGHDSWTATYDNPEFWEWLFNQKR